MKKKQTCGSCMGTGVTAHLLPCVCRRHRRPRRWRFAIGTRVRVQGCRQTGVIKRRYPGIAHGAVTLDRRIDGFRWWNEDSLIRVKR